MARLTGNEVRSLMEAYYDVYAPQEETGELISEIAPNMTQQQIQQQTQATQRELQRRNQASQSNTGTPLGQRPRVSAAGMSQTTGPRGTGVQPRPNASRVNAPMVAPADRADTGTPLGQRPTVSAAGMSQTTGPRGTGVQPRGQAPTQQPPRQQSYAPKLPGLGRVNPPTPSGAPIRGTTAPKSTPTAAVQPTRSTGTATAPAAPSRASVPTAATKPTPAASQAPSGGDALSQWAKANQKMIQTSGTQAQKDILSRAQSGQSQERMAPLGQGPKDSIFKTPSTTQTSPSTIDDTATTRKMTNPKTSLPSSLAASYEYEDAYDVVMEYLLSTGHADSLEEAHYLMLEMDEYIIQGILDLYELSEDYKENQRRYEKARKQAARRAELRNAARAEGKTGKVPGVGYVSGLKPERVNPEDKLGGIHRSNRKLNSEGYLNEVKGLGGGVSFERGHYHGVESPGEKRRESGEQLRSKTVSGKKPASQLDSLYGSGSGMSLTPKEKVKNKLAKLQGRDDSSGKTQERISRLKKALARESAQFF